MQKKFLRGAALCVFALLGGRAGVAQEAKETPEIYRVRVENFAMGRIEVSLDEGATYMLIGRVTQPATKIGVEGEAKAAGAVLRGSGFGLAFSVGKQKGLRLLPAPPPAPPVRRSRRYTPPRSEPSAIGTNLEANKGLFAELLPAIGTLTRLENPRGGVLAWPDSYAPGEEDIFVFRVAPPNPTEQVKTSLREKAKTLSSAYAASATARARANGRTVVSGNWTLRAQLPDGEPDPINFVVFLLNGEMVSTKNTPPFVYVWDTRLTPNGEHLLEVRALNKNAQLLTKTRALVAVENAPPK